MKLTSIIATSDRTDLLARTLWSLERAAKPSNYAGLIVVENGSNVARLILEQACLSFSWQHHFISSSNKSRALNFALSLVETGVAYFHDDDIVLSKQALLAMSEKINEYKYGFFFGGPVFVERECARPTWLEKKLPRSVTGWECPSPIINSNSEITFLGANWAANVTDLLAVGGFDENLGPGKLGTGQETCMQLSLLRSGLLGAYVEKSLVWHYVPTERCSAEWLLERSIKDGYYRSYLTWSQANSFERTIYPIKILYSFMLGILLLLLGKVSLRKQLAITGQIRVQWVKGEVDYLYTLAIYYACLIFRSNRRIE